MLYNSARVLPILALSLLASAGPLETREPVPGIIDDILTGVLSGVGQLIKDVLSGAKSAIDDTKSNKPLICSLLTTDKCCIWWDVSDELTKLFVNQDLTCNDNARAAVRMGFHDAGAWEQGQTHGGADGSLLMDFGEIERPENKGLESVRLVLRDVQKKFKVGYADLAQYAHNHASISCPKGPRVRTFVGRKDATQAAPKGFLPDTRSPADELIALFERKGFTPHDLAALLGAHSTARQRFVDTTPEVADKPLDTTIGVWDVEFYNDTLNNPSGGTPSQKVFVLPSDKVLSVHPKVSDEWKSFVGDQKHWNEDYAKAYVRMSLTGVTKDQLNNLVDCTKTLPASRKVFP
ncbi:KatG Catalase peroxidase I [Pyrenophora tritici-repentis]|uniref:Peroxidase n=2 Tax=Pyrenophora tritici-repentis TaxID=45151 RepID=A0A2W1EDH2_9PLEO|nr:ligninase LG6 precursor [Pyrenophora tritici-repentis Pt-1C-BFP]KAA8622551.1 Ligninase LG6 [Pyrenophora tritici-repentis]EDU45873.1 ligninase LG6 precursor [Pyrenophora tritici-repentis Pt-1C-BFP]KAF7451538.1 Ligninase LG6 [Pyrenophora tritici-repentis]KAF7575352.1 KatG, Catalase (peroxidase I) [Pyrenophora tritici-repentis]KAG9385898.1 Ligninase LG6 [Pyrenophora tritici-repentis]